MPSNFDWRAEDDRTWDEYVSGDPDDGKKPSGGKRPTFLIILGALLVVVVAGTFAYFQVRRYVENTAESVEEDVLSSHALVKLAAQENDLELLAPLLSGRDPKWTQDQLALLDMNLLLDRQPFGLVWRPQNTADDISVTLSPDLQSAEIEYVESYGYGLDGEEGVIQLTQTAVYRLSDTRWLLSPPADDFWGNWISSRGRYVILTFPERDEELGMRLASDLEATLAGACLNLNLNCDEPPHLDVLLATDLDAMMDISNPEHFAHDGDQLVLPAPTLLGKPANTASYRALYRGYATYLVSRLVAQSANWDCCQQSPFFQVLLDVQLQQLGLKPWPLQQDDYSAALRQPVELAAIRALWDEELTFAEAQERPDLWMLYAFIEFILNRDNELTALEWQRSLAPANTFNFWLTEAGITGSLNLVELEWREFMRLRISQSQGQPPVSWPEEDIALICNDGQSGIANVYRYDPAENRWTVELADRDFVVMNGLPDNQGLILTEQFLDVDKLRTILWRDGQETVVTYGDAFLFSAELFDPAGRYVVINIFQQNVVDLTTFDSGPYLLELDTCLPDNCPIIQAGGRPVWSPDGARTLWVIPEILNPLEMEDQIFLGDELLQSGEMVASGSDPFWLDNETYAFTVNPGSWALMAANINENTPEILLEAADLAALIPELEAAHMFVTNARADPAAPDLIFLTAVNSQDNTDHVFTFNWETGEINLVFSVEESYGGLTPHSFSPDHRWLAMRTFLAPPFSSGQRYQELLLYDIATQEAQSYGLVGDMILPTESWSNNGQWLVLLGPDFLILTAPGSNYDHLVQYSFRDCTGVAWITKVTR